MARLTLILPILERDALFRLARREAREPRAQAALIIRRELEQLGLLANDASAQTAPFAIGKQQTDGAPRGDRGDYVTPN